MSRAIGRPVALLLVAAAFAGGCGSGEDSTRGIADHLLSARDDGQDFKLIRLSKWAGDGPAVRAWVRIEPKGEKPHARCISIDTAIRIDNEDDLVRAVVAVEDALCGPKPAL